MGRFADCGAYATIRVHFHICMLPNLLECMRIKDALAILLVCVWHFCFFVWFFICPSALSANNGVRYCVVYNEKLIGEHIYDGGHLQSIISYGLVGKRDSFVLPPKCGVVEYSQTGAGYEKKRPFRVHPVF